MEKNVKPKIAIVHDHLGFRGGGERTVLLLALRLKADFITAYAHKDTYPEYQEQLGSRLKILTNKVIETRVVRFFWLRNLFWRSRKKFKDYDILIASSQTATEAVAHYSKKSATRIVYTHTTPRRVFDLYEISKNMYPFVLRGVYALFARYWKMRYLNAIRKFDINIANSNNVRKRIKDHTGGDANFVAWPPIMTDRFKWLSEGDYFLSFGRIDEAKRIELIVEAFREMPDKKLIIASGGPRLDKVKELAKGYSNIKIKGWVDDEELVSLVGKCLATIYIPIDEDAGMTHLESNVAGKPYLGVREGGLIESTLNYKTGILLPSNPNKEDLKTGIKKMTKDWCLKRRSICEEYARKYDQEKFFKKIEHLIKKNNNQKKIIGIDASRWEDPKFPGKHQRTGVEMVTVGLIKSLLEKLQKRDVRVRLYTPRTIQSLALSLQKVIPAKRQWTRKHLSNELKSSPVDFFFTPSYYIPKNAPKKSFSVVHDIVFRTNPEKYSLKERFRQEFVTKLNIKRSKKIFTVSKFSRDEIIREYKLSEDKVIAFPMGYSSQNSKFTTHNLQNVKKYILYIGRIEKKKSVDVLVKAFAQFSKKNLDWKLILLGKNGSGSEDVIKLVNKLGIKDKVEMLGYVNDEKKWGYLKQASLFVHPGAHEGSSLPILEAMDAGVPVVATDVPAIKEIGSDAVLYFRAGDDEDLYYKITKLVKNEESQNEMTVRGQELLKKHSWDKVAEIVLNEILK